MVGALSICIYIILSIFIYYIAKYQYLRAEYYRIILEKEKKKVKLYSNYNICSSFDNV